MRAMMPWTGMSNLRRDIDATETNGVKDSADLGPEM